MKPSAGAVTSPPITAPSPSVENSRNRERGNRSPGVERGAAVTGRRLRGAPAVRRHVGRIREVRAGGQVADPEETRRRPRERAEPGDPPRDDQADEQDDDADGEADRPETRTRNVRMVVVGCTAGSGGFKRSGRTPVNVVTGRANSDGTGRSCRGTVGDRARTRPSGGRRARAPRRSSRSRAATRGRPRRALRRRVDAELAAEELQRRRVVEVVERAFGDHDVALRDRRSRPRRTSPARSRGRRRARRRRRSPSSG